MNHWIAFACFRCKRQIQDVKSSLVGICYLAVINGNTVLFAVKNKGDHISHGTSSIHFTA